MPRLGIAVWSAPTVTTRDHAHALTHTHTHTHTHTTQMHTLLLPSLNVEPIRAPRNSFLCMCGPIQCMRARARTHTHGHPQVGTGLGSCFIRSQTCRTMPKIRSLRVWVRVRDKLLHAHTRTHAHTHTHTHMHACMHT